MYAIRSYYVCDVVVAGRAEERHVEPAQHPVGLVPLRVQLSRILAVALDQVADVDHELRLQEVDLIDGRPEGARNNFV